MKRLSQGKKKRPGSRAAGKSGQSKDVASVAGTAHSAAIDPESHLDGCDLEFTEADATPDSALPHARGGVEPGR